MVQFRLLSHNFYNILQKQMANSPYFTLKGIQKPTLRLIDKITFMIFKGNEIQLKELHSFLNTNVPHLSFTMEMDYNKLNFLDMWIVKGEHSFYTDLYTKPTDRNTLLKANSYHPLPLKNSLPYSQFCRLKRICKKESDFQLHLTETQNKFRKRGYGEQCIEEATNKISQKSRSDFFIQKTKKELKSMLFSTKYTKKS